MTWNESLVEMKEAQYHSRSSRSAYLSSVGPSV